MLRTLQIRCTCAEFGFPVELLVVINYYRKDNESTAGADASVKAQRHLASLATWLTLACGAIEWGNDRHYWDVKNKVHINLWLLKQCSFAALSHSCS